MKTRTPIIPIAFIPKTNVTAELFYTALPREWKDKLCELYSACNKNYDPKFPIGLNPLKRNLESWLGGVVAMTKVYKESDDSKWLISLCNPDVSRICEILKTWIAAEFITDKTTAEVKELARLLIDEIEPDVLSKGITSSITRLFNDDGTAASDFSYDAFSLIAQNQLIGKDIKLFNETLHLCSANGEVISSPLFYKNGGNKTMAYSFVFRLSVQTTPPDRRCMLYIHTSIRRFIYETKGEKLYLPDNINALIRTTPNSFRVVPISGDYKRNAIFWNERALRFYNLFELNNLPEAESVLRSPTEYYGEKGNVQILCPQALATKCASDFIIGSGVSMKDKHELFRELSALLSRYAEPSAQPEILPALNHYSCSASDQCSHRRRLFECTECTNFHFEIYAHSGSEKLVEHLKNMIQEYFGTDKNSSEDVSIDIRTAALGSLGNALNGEETEFIRQRIAETAQELGKAEKITAAFVVLPGKERYKEKRDPKNAIRAGFAKTGRLTQFITPDNMNVKYRAKSAFMDMLRQLGYTEQCKESLLPLLDVDFVGMYILSELMPICGNSKYDRARMLPVYVTFNPVSGKVYVDCDALDRRHLLYHEALLEFSAFSQSPEFTERCKNVLNGTIKQKLLGYSNLYRSKPAIFIVKADGKSRSLWNGISDKAIGEYDGSAYYPPKMDIGSKNSPYPLENRGELRIVRIRTAENREVPDCFTEYGSAEKCRSASGLFRYEKVYWGLDIRKNNKEYRQSQEYSRTESPEMNFDEHNLLELYPVMLKTSDNPEDWVRKVYITREAMPEYSENPVMLPAPLHFAKLMEEYLLTK